MYLRKNYLDENPSFGCGTCTDVDETYGTSIMYKNVEIFSTNIRVSMVNSGDFRN